MPEGGVGPRETVVRPRLLVDVGHPLGELERGRVLLRGPVRASAREQRLAEPVQDERLDRPYAEALGEPQGLLQQADRLQRPAGLQVGVGVAGQDERLAVPVVELAADRDRAFLVLDGRLGAALALLDEAELGDRLGLAAAVARLLAQRVRLAEQRGRGGEPAEAQLDDAELLEGDRAAAVVRQLLQQGERLAQIALSLRVLRLGEADRAEQVQGARLARAAAPLADSRSTCRLFCRASSFWPRARSTSASRCSARACPIESPSARNSASACFWYSIACRCRPRSHSTKPRWDSAPASAARSPPRRAVRRVLWCTAVASARW
jgi:hypothetical protein